MPTYLSKDAAVKALTALDSTCLDAEHAHMEADEILLHYLRTLRQIAVIEAYEAARQRLRFAYE